MHIFLLLWLVTHAICSVFNLLFLGSVKRIQANGMKPTIIEDSESDEDAIVTAKDSKEGGSMTLSALQNPMNNQANKGNNKCTIFLKVIELFKKNFS